MGNLFYGSFSCHVCKLSHFLSHAIRDVGLFAQLIGDLFLGNVASVVVVAQELCVAGMKTV